MFKNLNMPNYEDGSLVNLMSSIIQHFGGTSQYHALKTLPLTQLNEVDNVILVLIDGMGYNFFTRYASLVAPTLLDHLHARITSVFPSTTAAAMTTVYTGVSPKNHGCLAWFTYLKELGLISTIPPLKRRHYDDYITNQQIKAQDILQIQSIFEKIHEADGYFVISEKLKDSPYDSVVSHGAKEVVGFKDFSDSMEKIYKILQIDTKKKFILHYWDGLDGKCHIDGISNSVEHFVEIFRALMILYEKIQNLSSKTAIIVTADHGMVDIPKENIIKLHNHPKMEETLTLPLCGEGRAAFCYVRAPYRDQFEEYVRTELKEYCEVITMHELIDLDFFGLFESHSRFRDRVPDYVLLMKDNYIIMDRMLKETRIRLKAVHGGLSADELYVPLIIFQN